MDADQARGAAPAQRTERLERVVTDADTAAGFGPGLPAAASTPFILGLAEVACHRLLLDDLGEGEMTVGARAVIDHLAPSPVGATLVVIASLERAEGRRRHFRVEVHEGDVMVARVEHERAVVRRDRILERLVR
jgi:fluoroacetyl-CoA thioesterase